MRYRFIDDHRDHWPVSIQCDVLTVSRSGYYSWRRRGPSVTAQRRVALTERVREVHRVSRATYGSPRVHAELVAQGQSCQRKTVAKYMKQAGLRAKSQRRFRVSTTNSNHAHPIARNIVNRNFTPSRKNETWTTDITSIPTVEGWLYLAVVEDLFTRRIVGWSMSDTIDSRLVVDALQMALAREHPGKNLVVHSDRGVQYASEHYQRLLKQHGLTCSMSRKANCWESTEAAEQSARMQAKDDSLPTRRPNRSSPR